MYNHNRVIKKNPTYSHIINHGLIKCQIDSSRSQLEGAIVGLGESLKKGEKKPQFHDMIYPVTHNEEIDHRKMNRANYCSCSRKQTQMGKVICQRLHKQVSHIGF